MFLTQFYMQLLGSAVAQSDAFRRRGNVVINLVASDYDNTNFRWDNRATSGAFNAVSNGDFIAV